MKETIDALLEADALALHYRQPLEPVDGHDVPVYPPTYPPARDGTGHRHDTPYTVNSLRDGTLVATLDSIPSQANRMESCFGEGRPLEAFVPAIGVAAGGRTERATDLGHRIADAAMRASPLWDEIREAFAAYDGGDPVPVARLCPTALIYGAWDSRETRVKIPRLVRSEVMATDVDVFTRSVQFQGGFTQDDLGIADKDWQAARRDQKSPAARAGFAATPAVNQHGGVLVRGRIVQSAAVHLGALSEVGGRANSEQLSRYLLCLTLAALLDDHGGRDYSLRAGCWLAPEGKAQAVLVKRDGDRSSVSLDYDGLVDELGRLAGEVRGEPLSIPCGEERIEAFDGNRAAALLKAKDDGE